ncbi:hypothetical protein ACF1DV_25985 [Streptomyces achromogenes]|uniref:hypothetical protein n=1 Tax=Streptomyces achromogenes TaxID=67255 RepID=UPI0036FAF62C
MADGIPVEGIDEGVLAYQGQTWRVVSEPEIIDTDGDLDLIEVWVRRGEGNGEPQ